MELQGHAAGSSDSLQHPLEALSEISLSFKLAHGYNSHEEEDLKMRSVNVAELKNRLSKYLTFARAGEEVVIRDRNLPVAKLVPLSAEGAGDQELMLVAAGKMRLPKTKLDIKQLLKIPTGTVSGNKAIQSVVADRAEEL